MSGSSGSGASVRPALPPRELRGVAMRCGILAVSVLAHQASFGTLYGRVGDRTMPQQSGESTLAELRAVRSDIPVVITSGFHPEVASTLLQLPNVVGFLEKPHTPTGLEMLLASVA